MTERRRGQRAEAEISATTKAQRAKLFVMGSLTLVATFALASLMVAQLGALMTP